ncbi:MAG TPA: acyltransferase [Polyangia bacterium]|nr:acyltransferase [Polyangia bacterium]
MAEGSRTVRLAPLDALRGLAALAVPTFTHFQHFGGDRSTYPYDSLALVHWFYLYSQFFVDLFFVLSGVVMTYRYLEPLSDGRADGREFFVHRFSRLYPLHLLMLLVCAGVQWTLLANHHGPVIYAQDDFFTFVLHLTFLHLWFERGPGYNYASWSVCAEVFVYVLFFVFARGRRKTFLIGSALSVFVGVAVLSGTAVPLLNRNMARAPVGFFMGVLTFLAMRHVSRRGWGPAVGAACLGFLIAVLVVANTISYEAWIGSDPLPYGLALFPLLTMAALYFPPLSRVLSARPLTFLGDISYAIYLTHIPVQMILLSFTAVRGIQLPTTRPWFFWAWVGSLLILGTIVHYGFERPVMAWLRQRLLQRPAVRPVAAVVPAE